MMMPNVDACGAELHTSVHIWTLDGRTAAFMNAEQIEWPEQFSQGVPALGFPLGWGKSLLPFIISADEHQK